MEERGRKVGGRRQRRDKVHNYTYKHIYMQAYIHGYILGTRKVYILLTFYFVLHGKHEEWTQN